MIILKKERKKERKKPTNKQANKKEKKRKMRENNFVEYDTRLKKNRNMKEILSISDLTIEEIKKKHVNEC